MDWIYDGREPNGCMACREPHNGLWYATVKIGKSTFGISACERCKKKATIEKK